MGGRVEFSKFRGLVRDLRPERWAASQEKLGQSGCCQFHVVSDSLYFYRNPTSPFKTVL